MTDSQPMICMVFPLSPSGYSNRIQAKPGSHAPVARVCACVWGLKKCRLKTTAPPRLQPNYSLQICSAVDHNSRKSRSLIVLHASHFPVGGQTR